MMTSSQGAVVRGSRGALLEYAHSIKYISKLQFGKSDNSLVMTTSWSAVKVT